MKLKLLIFDLDDTLLDTTRLLLPIARTPAFEKRILQTLPLMEGAEENLNYLQKKYQLVLLTQGRPEAQKQKVASLKIETYFKGLYFVDPSQKQTKGQSVQKILRTFAVSAQEVLSIGNRRHTDIRESKQQGTWTCLFRYGEHQNEVVEIPADQPDFEVHHHQDLIKICQL